MATEIKLPELGENIESGTVVSILVSVGDTISKDQDLVEVETDKASLPVPSPVAGTITEILINEGDDISVGQPVFKIEAGDAPAAPEPAKAEATAPAAPTPAPAPTAPVAAPVVGQIHTASKDIPAAPSVRRLARELGLNVAQVPGTGPGGRISKDDVKAYAKLIILGQPTVAAGPEVKPLPDFSKWGDVEAEKMSKIRHVTAEHLSYAWTSIPHVTQFAKADITELNKIRKDRSTDKVKLTITPFIMKVMAAAFKEFPQFSSSVDMENKQVIYKKYAHIGVAVDTDRGLLVPVIRDVDKKSIIDIAVELNEAAERARDKKTSLDELRGGSMTLTNLGGIGGTSFTPIVNWPEVAILGISRGGYEQVYDGKEFQPRMMLPLSLSYDHRIIDGADGARYIRWVCDKIENPSDWALEN